MLKKPTPHAGQTQPTSASGESYAHKPFKIGPILKARAKEKGYSAKYIGSQLGIYHRTVYRKYKMAIMSIKELLKWSKVLDQNFLLLYRPDIKPEPNPAQAELDKATSYRQEMDVMENEIGMLKNKIIRLEGQLEQALDMLERKGGR